MEGITYIDNFIDNSTELFQWLQSSVNWDERMQARKTASFGRAYNYSQISYPFQEIPNEINEVIEKIMDMIGFKPNNCLINYYLDGKSKMGFHSDQTEILAENTGVVIVSLGETRTLRFRNIANKDIIQDFALSSGSMIHMSNHVQELWQHAIPKSQTEQGRMSLTFRQLL